MCYTMLTLIVSASLCLTTGLRLNTISEASLVHSIDWKQFNQDWPDDIVKYMNSPPADADSLVFSKDFRQGEPKKSCTGDICKYHGSGAPTLFVNARPDGLGARSQSIIAAMALATKYGLNFGGALGVKGKPHGIDAVPMMSALFGTDVRADLVPPGVVSFESVADFEEFFKKGNELHATSVLLRDFCVQCGLDKIFNDTNTLVRDYYSPEFLNHIRKANSLSKRSGSQSKPLVVLHVRRGDAKGKRRTNDQFYYNVVHDIKKHLPNADVHLFSEGSPDEFDGYRQQGVQLHLDSTDVREAWEYFSSADVFVMAKSSFSMVPALFNTNCVIYTPFWHSPLDEWMVVDQSALETANGQL